MKGCGGLADLATETARIRKLIEDEFESIEPENHQSRHYLRYADWLGTVMGGALGIVKTKEVSKFGGGAATISGQRHTGYAR